MVSFILSAGLLALPFTIRMTSYVNTLRMSKEIFLLLIMSLVFFFYNKTKEIDFSLKALFVGFLCFAYFNTSIFASINFWLQFQFVSISLVFFYFLLTTKLNKSLIENSLRIICLIDCSWIILNYFNIPIYDYIVNAFFNLVEIKDNSGGIYPIGFLANPNLDGALISLLSPLFITRKFIIFLPIILIVLLLGKSTIPLATFLGIILYFVYNKYTKEKWLPYIAFILVGGFFILNGFPGGFLSDNSRLEVWEKSIGMIENTLTGNGLGHFALNFSKKYIVENQRFVSAHSEYVQMFYNFGFIGLSAMAFTFIHFIKNTNNLIYSSFIFGLSINLYGNFTFHIMPTSIIIMIMLAIGYKYESTMERKSLY